MIISRCFNWRTASGAHTAIRIRTLTRSSDAQAAPQLLQADVSHGGAAVAVTWSSGFHSAFHAKWLWVNESSHFQRGSGQRTLRANAVTSGPPVKGVSTSSHGLHVEWADGRESTFSSSWLLQHDYSPDALRCDVCKSDTKPLEDTRRPYTGVDRGRVADFTYGDVMRSDAVLLDWLRAINSDGVTIVKDAPLVDRTVLSVASRVAAPMRTIYGEVWEVQSQPTPINIAYSSVELDLHMDLAYYESPPGLQFLHCRRFDADVAGGESTFLDGHLAAEEFRRRDFTAFTTLTRVPATFQKVHYERDDPVHIVARRPHIVVDHSLGVDARTAPVTAVFWAPPFEGPLRVPPGDVEAYYDAYGKFAALLAELEAERRYLIEYRAKPGEIAVFNNRRMLHGRRHYSSGAAPGARLLQGTYVNADEALSRLRTLESTVPLRERRGVGRVGNQQSF